MEETEIADQEKGSLVKRKDILGTDRNADSHPNRTYYYRKHVDLNEVITTCSKKLQVCCFIAPYSLSYCLASKLDPYNVKALFLRGHSFFKQKEYPKALKDFSNGLRYEPKHVETLYYRGMCAVEVVARRDGEIRNDLFENGSAGGGHP